MYMKYYTQRNFKMIKISLMDFEDGRYERKFFISDLSTNEIEKIIKFSSYFFSETFYKRDVNNLYLDSFDLDSYSDNLVGNNQRMKIRIRWYGKMFEPAKNPVLEIKIKNNHLGKKMQFNLEPFRLDKNFSREYLQKEIFAYRNMGDDRYNRLKIGNITLKNVGYLLKAFSEIARGFKNDIYNHVQEEPYDFGTATDAAIALGEAVTQRSSKLRTLPPLKT